VRRLTTLLIALALLAGSTPARGQGLQQLGFATFTTNVTLTTTTETVVVSSDPVPAPRQTVNVCVVAWAQLTTGTGTTTVTARIQRGTAATGTVVGEGNAVTIGAAAGSTEQYLAMACEERSNVESLQYNLSLEQAGATGNGTALFGAIVVLVQ